MSITIDDLWAKTSPFESVESHLIRTGLVCKVGLTKSSLKSVWNILRENIAGIDDENLLKFICYIVSMHDIGKVSPFFQSYDEKTKEKLKNENLYYDVLGKKYYHELQSKEYICKILLDKYNITTEIVFDLGFCIALHHNRLDSGYESQDLNVSLLDPLKIKRKKWWDLIYKIESDVYNLFSFGLSDEIVIINKDVFFNFLSGLIIICDWIASNSLLIDISIDKVIKNDLLILSFLDKLGFIKTEYQWKNVSYNNLLNNSTELRPLQKWTLDSNNFDLEIIETGTGEGKTSVGLYTAFHNMKDTDGFYFALPMKSMVESKYNELKLFLSQNNLTLNLLHGSRLLVDDIDEYKKYFDKYNMYFDEYLNKDIVVSDYLVSNSRLGLFNKYIVGTIDQLLFSVLPNKFSVLRLIGLAGKTLILDEIHAYDVYTQELICVLLSWCKVLHIKVILMSATLTKSIKEKFIQSYLSKKVELSNRSYPLVTTVDKNEVIEYEVDSSIVKHEHIILKDILLDELEQSYEVKKYYDNKCNIIVFKNTIASAQSLYQKCLQLGISKNNIILCHASFDLEDRHKKEKRILELFSKDISNRPSGFVVISTQVLEASLDIDFDVCLSDIAPIDILIQRWGRKCRFNLNINNKFRGVNIVFIDSKLDFGSSKYIYYKLFLVQTLNYLNSHSDLEFPLNMRHCIESVYSNIDMTNEELLNDYIYYFSDSKIKINKGKQYSISKPDCNNFSLRLNFNSMPNEEEKYSYTTRLFNNNRSIIIIDKKDLMGYNLNELSLCDYKSLMKHSLSISENKYFENDSFIHSENKWLKYIIIIPICNGELKVSNKNGEHIYLYDDELGLRVQ